MNEDNGNKVYLEGGVPAGVICWLLHHQTLIEVTTEPMAGRIRFVKESKSSEEIPIRLKWMRPVWGKLPVSVVDAGRRLVAVQKSLDKNWTPRASNSLRAASMAWSRAVKRCQKSIEKLHALECPGCPWNGETLFPRRRGG
jgi:hypothetical protein